MAFRRVPAQFPFVSLLVVPVIAWAQSGRNDNAVTRLADEAMNQDYLSTQFEEAAKKLTSAINLCVDGCSPQVEARVHRDLGVIYVVGLGRTEDGRAEFELACRTDARVRLDQDLATDEVRDVFAQACDGIDASEPAPAAAPSPEPPPARGLIASPLAEQMVNTPVPIYVQPEDGADFTKVRVRYRPFGVDAWKTLFLKRVKQGWGIEIPCLDVTTTGTLDYYVEAFDASGEVVAASGSESEPHTTQIVSELAGDPPHLPGRPPAAQCRDFSDCPPDFPGCGPEDVEKTPRKKDESVANWIGLSFQQDLLHLASATGVCEEGSDYACFDQSDGYYTIDPYDSGNGEIAGGFSRATMRLMVGYDRILAKNWSLGARVGYAFGGGPQAPGGNAFVPVHAEIRAGYWFGSAPFASKGIRPFVELSGGLAQVDSEVDVKVYDDANAYLNDETTTLQAWRKTGTTFVSAGGGAAFAVSERHELAAELRVMQMFGVSGTAIAFNLGYAFGI